MQAGCRITADLQSRDGRLSICRLLARGRSAGRLFRGVLRVSSHLVELFAGRWVGFAAVRDLAPESHDPGAAPAAAPCRRRR